MFFGQFDNAAFYKTNLWQTRGNKYVKFFVFISVFGPRAEDQAQWRNLRPKTTIDNRQTTNDKRRRQLVERYFINSGCLAEPIRLAWLWFTAIRIFIQIFSPPYTYEQSVVVRWADLFMFVLLCKMPFTAHQRGLISIQICSNQTSTRPRSRRLWFLWLPGPLLPHSPLPHFSTFSQFFSHISALETFLPWRSMLH